MANASSTVAREPRPRWSPRRRLTTGALTLAVLVGIALVGSYGLYKEWPWSAYPSRLYACGRDFIDSGSQTREQIRAEGNSLIRVGSVPGWLNHGQLWTTSSGQPLPGHDCRVVMWVRTGKDTFESYGLSGGP
jgi:hypothetical protein